MKQLILPALIALFMATPTMATEFATAPIILASSHQAETEASEGTEDEEPEEMEEGQKKDKKDKKDKRDRK